MPFSSSKYRLPGLLCIWSLSILLIGASSCQSKTQKETENHPQKGSSSILPGKYRYSCYAEDIPGLVADSLKKIYKNNFRLGDEHNKYEVNLSDAWGPPSKKGVPMTNKKMKFVLVGMDTCVLVFEEGGYASHDVVWQCGYNKNRIVSLKGYYAYSILDTNKLRFFFTSPKSRENIMENYSDVAPFFKGKWVEEKDPRSHLAFSDTLVEETYQGLKMRSVFSYRITDRPCDSSLLSTRGTGFYLQETGKDGTVYCYAIVDASEDLIELVYSGGKLITYVRPRL